MRYDYIEENDNIENNNKFNFHDNNNEDNNIKIYMNYDNFECYFPFQ